jgi:hypothetical protein
MSKKRGRPLEYASPAEANRQRQQRHRDKQLALRLQLRGGEVTSAFAQCVKCNSCAELTRQAGTAVVCDNCQRERDAGLASFKLTENRASTNHAGKIISGGYNPVKVDTVLAASDGAQHGRSNTHTFNDEGKAVTKGRYTGPSGKKHILQVCAEGCVESEQIKRAGKPRNPREQMMQVWWSYMEYSPEAGRLRKQFPTMPPSQLRRLLLLSDAGKKVLRKLETGAPVRDSSPRNETLAALLKKGD